MTLLTGNLRVRPLILKPTELMRGEFILLDYVLYEVAKVDRYKDYIDVSFNQKSVERMNLNMINSKAQYIVLETGDHYYEVRIQPNCVKQVLYALYNAEIVKAKLVKIPHDVANSSIAMLLFND